MSRPSGERMQTSEVPPSRKSILATGAVKPVGPHQRITRSGSDQAFHTSSTGASKTRVTTMFFSPGSPVVPVTLSSATVASLLLDDAEREVRDPGALYHLRVLQLDGRRAQVLEQPDAVPEQDGRQVDVYLVEEPRPEALLREACGANGDVPVSRYLLRLLDGALDAVRDERERGPLVDPFLRDRVGYDEGRYAQGRVAAPPVGDVEGPPPRHERPHPGVRPPRSEEHTSELQSRQY